MLIGRMVCAALTMTASATFAQAAHARNVVMISIDGLRADDITNGDTLGIKTPTLRRLAAEGVHAKGVQGVLPTVTYPSHTTMITGVHPAKHGIANNVAFDPPGRNQGGWMWYAEDIRVPTLWDTVKAKGGVVASIGWPVSVGKGEIDYNIPEFWRVKEPEDEKLLRAVSTPGMPAEMERLTGVPFAKVALDPGDTHQGMDDARLKWLPVLIGRYKPKLTTVHLVELDGVRHKFGPHSKEAKEALEKVDRDLGATIEKLRAVDPDIVLAIVSDHGFYDTTKALNLEAALAAEGLLTHDAKGKIADWQAVPWTMGGSVALVLKNPRDKAAERHVRAMLAKLAADPANGIDRVLERAGIARLGGTRDASFWITMKPGFSTTGGPGATLVREISGRGAHGYAPDQPALQSVFIMHGQGITPKALGLIDMRDIAPTIGALLGAQLPSFDGKVIPIAIPAK